MITHGTTSAYRKGCRCDKCRAQHLASMRTFHEAGKAPSRSYIISLLEHLPVGQPHILTPGELGGEAAWNGRTPEHPDDPIYMQGYDLWAERRRLLLEVRQEKALSLDARSHAS